MIYALLILLARRFVPAELLDFPAQRAAVDDAIAELANPLASVAGG
jgi:hypothetical protein